MAVQSAILGLLLCFALKVIAGGSIPGLKYPYALPGAAVLGGLLGLGRTRILLWIAAGITGAVVLIVGYTPWIGPAARGLIVRDALAPSDAVVVLSSGVMQNGELTDESLRRLTHGWEVLHQGYAPRLLLTRVKGRPSSLAAVKRHMELLGLHYPVEEAGPVADTHDEALNIAGLMRKRRWKRIVLVSDPTHMRRSAAVFRKAGANILCSPGMQTDLDLEAMPHSGDRLTAFQVWLHEVIGYEVYRLRGWI